MVDLFTQFRNIEWLQSSIVEAHINFKLNLIDWGMELGHNSMYSKNEIIESLKHFLVQIFFELKFSGLNSY